MRNDYRMDRTIATLIIVVFFAALISVMIGAYTTAVIRQKLILQRSQEVVSLWTALWYPNSWFTSLDIIEIPADEEQPQG